MSDLSASLAGRSATRVTDVRKLSLFKTVDADGSGQIDMKEFGELYDVIKTEAQLEMATSYAAEQKATKMKSRAKLLGCLSLFLGIFLALSVAANTAVIFYAFDIQVKTTAESGGVMNVKGTDNIAKTAEATTSVPLIVAPLLSSELLDRLKSVRLTRNDTVKEHYTVIGHTWRNKTSMTLHTVRGDKIEIHNGFADLVIGEKKFPVCEADVTCSALKVTESEIDVDALMTQLPTQPPKCGSGRRLFGGRCPVCG